MAKSSASGPSRWAFTPSLVPGQTSGRLLAATLVLEYNRGALTRQGGQRHAEPVLAFALVWSLLRFAWMMPIVSLMLVRRPAW
jgi:hypothetical protein